MIEVELWGVAAAVACAVVPWAFSIHAKVAVIANSVESLPEIVEELREALEEHEARLNEHARFVAITGRTHVRKLHAPVWGDPREQPQKECTTHGYRT